MLLLHYTDSASIVISFQKHEKKSLATHARAIVVSITAASIRIFGDFSDLNEKYSPTPRVLALIVLVLATACGQGEPESLLAAPPISPQRSSVESTSEPSRLVSLTPLATRFILALGAKETLVGLDAQSRTLPGLQSRPSATLAQLHQDLNADLILVKEIPLDDSIERGLQAEGVTVLAFDPHDVEDVVALSRQIAPQLVGPQRAQNFERDLTHPLGLIGGLSSPTDRPRVLAIVGIDPIEIAGGHSFETDLIEIAGATSLTHGGEDTRTESTLAGIRAWSPDLLLVTSNAPLSKAEAETIRDALPAEIPTAFFDFDREFFWLDHPEKDAMRLHKLLVARFPRITNP